MPPSPDEKKISDGIRRRTPLKTELLTGRARPSNPAPERTTPEIPVSEKRTFWDALRSVKEPLETAIQEKIPEAPKKKEEILSSLPEEIVITDPFPPVRKKSQKTDTPPHARTTHGKWIAGGVAGVAVLITAFILASTVFARATVKIKPATETAPINAVAITLDTSISKTLANQRVIPAERFEFSKTETQNFPATGTSVLEEKSRGTVKIYNQFNSTPQRIIATTRFITEKGILFRIPKAVTIPGAKIEQGKVIPQFVEAELVADAAGEGSNIPGSVTLRIPGFQGTPKYDGFYAVAESGFSGGFKGSATVASADDLAKAQETLTKKVYDSLAQEIAQKIPQEFKALNALRQIEITNLNAPPARTRTASFSVSVQGTGRTLVFREEDIISLLAPIIVGNASTTKRFVDGSAQINYQVASADLEKGKAGITVSGSATTETILPERELMDALRGKRKPEILNFLSAYKGVTDFSLSLFPPWNMTAPAEAGKIKLIIHTSQSAGD